VKKINYINHRNALIFSSESDNITGRRQWRELGLGILFLLGRIIRTGENNAE
jgi:hypothetical protein